MDPASSFDIAPAPAMGLKCQVLGSEIVMAIGAEPHLVAHCAAPVVRPRQYGVGDPEISAVNVQLSLFVGESGLVTVEAEVVLVAGVAASLLVLGGGTVVAIPETVVGNAGRDLCINQKTLFVAILTAFHGRYYVQICLLVAGAAVGLNLLNMVIMIEYLRFNGDSGSHHEEEGQNDRYDIFHFIPP